MLPISFLFFFFSNREVRFFVLFVHVFFPLFSEWLFIYDINEYSPIIHFPPFLSFITYRSPYFSFLSRFCLLHFFLPSFFPLFLSFIFIDLLIAYVFPLSHLYSRVVTVASERKDKAWVDRVRLPRHADTRLG